RRNRHHARITFSQRVAIAHRISWQFTGRIDTFDSSRWTRSGPDLACAPRRHQTWLAMNRSESMSTITTKDGTTIYYKDWGTGPVVTFSHGWPLNADAWNGQMLFLVQKGFRVIAHDRRGHGRSGQSSSGNDMDGYADDLAAVIEAL